MGKKLKSKINILRVQKLQNKRGLAHHDVVVADECGEGRNLVRASVTILCVRKGMSLTNPALTSSRTK